MNNGLETATIYFQFYDSTGAEVSHTTTTLPSRAHFGDHVRIPGMNFIGSIVITFNQPFTGEWRVRYLSIHGSLDMIERRTLEA